MNNSVLFIGRVEQEPIKLTSSDKKLLQFAVAVNKLCFYEPRFFEVRSANDVAERVLATVSFSALQAVEDDYQEAAQTLETASVKVEISP